MPEAIVWFQRRSGLTGSVRISAANMDSGAYTRYFFYFKGDQEGVALEDEADQHPRWSDSTLGLIFHALVKIIHARARQQASRSNAKSTHVDDPVSQVDISVSTSPNAPGVHREHEGISASISEHIATCAYRNPAYTGPVTQVRVSTTHDICQLCVELIGYITCGSSEPVPIPLPLSVPIRVWGDKEYILSSDLPEVILREFQRYLPDLSTLEIPMQRPGNCIKITDWKFFLENTARSDSFGSRPSFRAV